MPMTLSVLCLFVLIVEYLYNKTTALLLYSYLKPIESAVIFESEDVVWDGEEVTVCSHQSP